MRRIWWIGGMVLAGSAWASAALVLETDQSSYSVAAGVPAYVHVYLRETAGEITAGGGLNGTAVVLAAQPPLPSEPLTLTAITPAAAFNFNSTSLSSGLLSVARSGLSEGVLPASGWVEVGVFTLSLGSGNVGQSTTYQITPAKGEWTYLADGSGPLDSTLVSSASFTVAVPEPSCLGLLGMTTLTMLGGRKRRAERVGG